MQYSKDKERKVLANSGAHLARSINEMNAIRCGNMSAINDWLQEHHPVHGAIRGRIARGARKCKDFLYAHPRLKGLLSAIGVRSLYHKLRGVFK